MSIPQSVPQGYTCGLKCSPGYYPAPSPSSWNTTLKQCKECGKGYECPDGDQRNQCRNGTFSSSFTATSCEPCPTGSTTSGAAPFISNSQCSACLGGYEYNNNKCQQCPPGTFAAAGRNMCEPCPKNTYSLAGAASCSRCMDGEITWIKKATECHNSCPTGLTPFPKCNDTIAGYQLNTSSSDANSLYPSVEKCPKGYFKDKSGPSPCSPCPTGTYSDTEGATSCTKCPKDKPLTKSSGATDVSFCIFKLLDCNTKGSSADSCLMKGVPPMTTDCKQETCPIPGQLCQVPEKNVYSCCAYTLPKSEMNGGKIPPFDELPMKWQSMGNTKSPVSSQNGGCLNYKGVWGSHPATTMAVGITPSDVGKTFNNTWADPNKNVLPQTLGDLGMLTGGGAYYLKPPFGDLYAPFNPEKLGDLPSQSYTDTIANRKKCSYLASLQNRKIQTFQSPPASSIYIYFEGTGDPNTCAGSESKGTPPTPSYYVDT